MDSRFFIENKSSGNEILELTKFVSPNLLIYFNLVRYWGPL